MSAFVTHRSVCSCAVFLNARGKRQIEKAARLHRKRLRCQKREKLRAERKTRLSQLKKTIRDAKAVQKAAAAAGRVVVVDKELKKQWKAAQEAALRRREEKAKRRAEHESHKEARRAKRDKKRGRKRRDPAKASSARFSLAIAEQANKGIGVCLADECFAGFVEHSCFGAPVGKVFYRSAVVRAVVAGHAVIVIVIVVSTCHRLLVLNRIRSESSLIGVDGHGECTTRLDRMYQRVVCVGTGDASGLQALLVDDLVPSKVASSIDSPFHAPAAPPVLIEFDVVIESSSSILSPSCG
ncbi:unnamed protein product [Heligmosomoides polygyrus]|uniref:BZIP domain-containing protein n=1 Tax=Heligmosomoides polygyrus TaxID=6339 RepID=A0A3P8C2X3_HELPZ|nr:unnamed protein product [Heligmosomoides polygyrus]